TSARNRSTCWPSSLPVSWTMLPARVARSTSSSAVRVATVAAPLLAGALGGGLGLGGLLAAVGAHHAGDRLHHRLLHRLGHLLRGRFQLLAHGLLLGDGHHQSPSLERTGIPTIPG